jgi:hypothetical protein
MTEQVSRWWPSGAPGPTAASAAPRSFGNDDASNSGPCGAGWSRPTGVLAFSYAIVAIAITLLTLDLEVRPGLPGDDLARALHQVLPAFGADVLSFVILGQLWLSHHRSFGVIARAAMQLQRRIGAAVPVGAGRLVRNACSACCPGEAHEFISGGAIMGATRRLHLRPARRGRGRRPPVQPGPESRTVKPPS